MMRVLLSALAGAIVYFIWQMLAWMMLPIHGPTISSLPNEAAVRDVLVEQNVDSGVYIVPFGTNEEMADPDSEFMKRHQEGPIFAIYYHKGGLDPMMMSVMLTGFAVDFLGVLLAATLLAGASDARCYRSYMARVGFVTGLGVFLGLMGHMTYHIWMHFDLYYTIMFVVDVVIGWFLVGLVVAAMVRPKKQVETA